MKKEDLVLRLVGGVAIVVAILGLFYNLAGLPAYFSSLKHDPEIPYFVPAFVIMSSVCIVCYVALIVVGIQFVRGRSRLARIFTGIIVFEVIYFFAVGMLWIIPKIGMSIAAATGVSNGGLMIQAFILFPLWAPIAVIWASKKQNRSSNQGLPATP